MKKEIKIIGKNYPKVGDIFYWKDMEGEIHEDTCIKIEEEDNPDLETMYFISFTENGGGCFISESAVLNPLSMEIEVYKRKKYEKKAKEIADLFNDEEFRIMLYSPLRKYFGEDGATDMLDKLIDILGNIENYDYRRA